MNTTKKELRMLTDDIIDYTFEKLNEKLKDFKIEFKKELGRQFEKQTEEMLIAINKMIERNN